MNKSTYMTVENPMEAVFKYLSISIVFMFVGFLFGKLFVPASLVYAAICRSFNCRTFIIFITF